MGDDARGNLIEKQQGTQVQKLAWDGFNRLAALETPNGKTEYAYDVFGRRIGKRHNGQTTTFVWDGDVIALERSAEQTRHYLFEAGSFVPLAQVVEKGGDGASKTSHTAYYHVDHLGTPQLLTDADGEIAWSAEYKAWGEAKALISQAAQSAGIDNPIRFQGQYFDAESGLHYNRHRYYDPETGRFISSDPIGLLGGLNTHAYAPNPVGWVDPLGLMGVRKDQYPTRVRPSKKRELERKATSADGNMYCPKCGQLMTSKTASVQHTPPLVETHNTLGYNTDQATRNDLYNSTATELNCLPCQKSEGGTMSHQYRYREDTGPNYEPRKPRKK